MADHLAAVWNQKVQRDSFKIHFVEPMIFELDGVKYFGEPYVPGKFIKWNNNAGETNRSEEARANDAAYMVACFTHYTFEVTQGNLMVVDIQGPLGGCGQLNVMLWSSLE